MLKLHFSLLIALTFLISATAQEQLSRTIQIFSEPGKATVVINGKEVGKTPMEYDFEIFKDYLVKAKIPGHYSDLITINSYYKDEMINFVLFPEGESNHHLVSLEGGVFMLGGGKQKDNDTRTKVELSAFDITKFEITNRQYSIFLNDINCNRSGLYKGARLINMSAPNCKIVFEDGRFNVDQTAAQQPAVNVTWYGADEYCRWAGGRLPTEAEWEYAGIGNTEKFSYSGSNSADQVAWYNENSDDRIHNVGEKKPNSFGLYDMSGNAMEWVNDNYGKNAYFNASHSNPDGPRRSKYKVVRGGAWNRGRTMLNVKHRYYLAPDYSNENLGFRCVFITNN